MRCRTWGLIGGRCCCSLRPFKFFDKRTHRFWGEGLIGGRRCCSLRPFKHFDERADRLWGEAYAWLADIVVQEHEREGGQGYPEGLRGDKIHAYAKIIGLADVYEALTHVRSYRRGFTPFEAVREILASQKDFFPMPILKSMVAQLSVFPLQSYVLLNSKAIGQVVATHEAAPLRPVVRLLYDSQRKPVQGEKLVDLRSNQLLYITDTLSAEAIATYTS